MLSITAFSSSFSSFWDVKMESHFDCDSSSTLLWWDCNVCQLHRETKVMLSCSMWLLRHACDIQYFLHQWLHSMSDNNHSVQHDFLSRCSSLPCCWLQSGLLFAHPLTKKRESLASGKTYQELQFVFWFVWVNNNQWSHFLRREIDRNMSALLIISDSSVILNGCLMDVILEDTWCTRE